MQKANPSLICKNLWAMLCHGFIPGAVCTPRKHFGEGNATSGHGYSSGERMTVSIKEHDLKFRIQYEDTIEDSPDWAQAEFAGTSYDLYDVTKNYAEPKDASYREMSETWKRQKEDSNAILYKLAELHPILNEYDSVKAFKKQENDKKNNVVAAGSVADADGPGTEE